jgi:hypothetical protein
MSKQVNLTAESIRNLLVICHYKTSKHFVKTTLPQAPTYPDALWGGDFLLYKFFNLSQQV